HLPAPAPARPRRPRRRLLRCLPVSVERLVGAGEPRRAAHEPLLYPLPLLPRGCAPPLPHLLVRTRPRERAAPAHLRPGRRAQPARDRSAGAVGPVRATPGARGRRRPVGCPHRRPCRPAALRARTSMGAGHACVLGTRGWWPRRTRRGRARRACRAAAAVARDGRLRIRERTPFPPVARAAASPLLDDPLPRHGAAAPR